MSIDRCRYCNKAVDTDLDDEFYGPDDLYGACENCREDRQIDREREQMDFEEKEAFRDFMEGEKT
jgi:hypothetical protein